MVFTAAPRSCLAAARGQAVPRRPPRLKILQNPAEVPGGSMIKATNLVYKQAQQAPQTQPKAKEAWIKTSYCRKGKTKDNNTKRAAAHRNRGMLHKQQEQGANLSCPSYKAKGISKAQSKKTHSQLPSAVLQLSLSTSGWVVAFFPSFFKQTPPK